MDVSVTIVGKVEAVKVALSLVTYTCVLAKSEMLTKVASTNGEQPIKSKMALAMLDAAKMATSIALVHINGT